MKVCRSAATLRAALGDGPAPVGFVPTMGALHAGHLSLVTAAVAANAATVVSIFVNPLQFGPGEDFEAYPRDLDRDLGLLDGAGVDVVFHPEASAFTARDRLTTVHVAGLTEHLEGSSRPGHFDGVTTIVTKLFSVVRPDRAYFGEKDYQQLAVIRRMVADLDLGVTVEGLPIVRDADGLALSSRNVYLSPDERRSALAMPAALHDVADSWGGDADFARSTLRRTLGAAPGVRLDYAEVVHPETLEPLEGVVGTPARALAAIRVGGTRLIDNVRLEPPARVA